MKKWLFKALRISGLPFLFRELIQKNKVTILLFHDISQETAELSFSYLARKYNIIDLNDFVEACDKKDKTKIPKKALIITFDDGHIRNHEMLPVIRKYKIPITIFACSSIISTNRHYWFKFKHESISIPELRRKSNIERLNILSNAGFGQEKEFGEPQALQKAHIDEMKHNVNIQSHTMFHPILPKCNDSEARLEIFSSKRMLESEYGLRINAISYPHGDYSERDIVLSKQAGYKCGLTVDFGFNTIGTDVFRLKRICVNDTDDINELIVKSSGLWEFLRTRNGRKQDFGLSNTVE
jgi:peptidoglycan/xylan/chitin deacetylase (PgdA/CDA1 family)